jgi:hypothetical protein
MSRDEVEDLGVGRLLRVALADLVHVPLAGLVLDDELVAHACRGRARLEHPLVEDVRALRATEDQQVEFSCGTVFFR